MRALWWFLIIISTVLGLLGYAKDLSKQKWKTWILWTLPVVFLLLSAGREVFNWYTAKKSAEYFYSKEIVRVYPKNSSQNELKFFRDNFGNKCVAIQLEHEPIPKSVKLWEGGYAAPPITLEISGKEIIFKHSSYSSTLAIQAA